MNKFLWGLFCIYDSNRKERFMKLQQKISGNHIESTINKEKIQRIFKRLGLFPRKNFSSDPSRAPSNFTVIKPRKYNFEINCNIKFRNLFNKEDQNVFLNNNSITNSSINSKRMISELKSIDKANSEISQKEKEKEVYGMNQIHKGFQLNKKLNHRIFISNDLIQNSLLLNMNLFSTRNNNMQNYFSENSNEQNEPSNLNFYLKKPLHIKRIKNNFEINNQTPMIRNEYYERNYTYNLDSRCIQGLKLSEISRNNSFRKAESTSFHEKEEEYFSKRRGKIINEIVFPKSNLKFNLIKRHRSINETQNEFSNRIHKIIRVRKKDLNSQTNEIFELNDNSNSDRILDGLNNKIKKMKFIKPKYPIFHKIK